MTAAAYVRAMAIHAEIEDLDKDLSLLRGASTREKGIGLNAGGGYNVGTRLPVEFLQRLRGEVEMMTLQRIASLRIELEAL
jgi:hypothetical protein